MESACPGPAPGTARARSKQTVRLSAIDKESGRKFSWPRPKFFCTPGLGKAARFHVVGCATGNGARTGPVSLQWVAEKFVLVPSCLASGLVGTNRPFSGKLIRLEPNHDKFCLVIVDYHLV